MNIPGFMRCRVWTKHEDKTYSGYATAAFTPEDIKPTTTLPTDFEAFGRKRNQKTPKYPSIHGYVYSRKDVQERLMCMKLIYRITV